MKETLQLALRFLSLDAPTFLSLSQLTGTPCSRRMKPITGQLANELAHDAGDLSADSRCLFPIHPNLHSTKTAHPLPIRPGPLIFELRANPTVLKMSCESPNPGIP